QHDPGGALDRNPVACAENDEPDRKHDVGDDENAAPAAAIDRAADPGTKRSREEEGAREGAEHPRARHPGGGRHVAGKDRRQIIAGSPGQGLRASQRRNHHAAGGSINAHSAGLDTAKSSPNICVLLMVMTWRAPPPRAAAAARTTAARQARAA